MVEEAATIQEQRMNVRTLLIGAVIVVQAAAAWAQAPGQAGTSDEQAACRADTRKHCRQVKAGSDDNAFLACLQANRNKLSATCRQVLETHGL
jgi:hypothetical protein